MLVCEQVDVMIDALRYLAGASSNEELRELGSDNHGKLPEKVTLHRLKNRMDRPTSGGWADLMVNFSLNSDEAAHVCEASTSCEHAPLPRVASGLPRPL